MRKIFAFLIFMICVTVGLCGCSNKKSTKVSIQLNEYESEDGTVSEIPEFTSSSDEYRLRLGLLNAETDELTDLCEDPEKNTKVVSDVNDASRIAQVTSYWNEQKEDKTEWNLLSLAFDRESGDAINCRKALDLSGLTGVQLTMNVASIYKKTKSDGDVYSTEMQGFYLDPEGNVAQIYMKLLIDKGDEEPEEHFYAYDPDQQTLTPLSEKGYELP